MLLYIADPVEAAKMMETMTPEQGEQMNQLWMAWAAQAGENLIDFGLPAMPASENAKKDGPNRIGGYSIVQAQDEPAVQAMIAEHPHKKMGGDIYVFELMPMPGM